MLQSKANTMQNWTSFKKDFEPKLPNWGKTTFYQISNDLILKHKSNNFEVKKRA